MKGEKEELLYTRDAYGETLVELGKDNPNIVVLDADLSGSTRTAKFAKVFPERFFNLGVAEQNMMGVAAGLASCGKIAFASTFAMFGTGRAWGQIRNTISYNKLNVKIVLSHAGITVGEDGSSHQALEDVGLMRVIPNMKVIIPCDAPETREAVRAVAKISGPVYIRLSRSKVPSLPNKKTPFKIGKARILREGKDIALIACGIMVKESLEAALLLEKQGVSCAVINMHTIKPLDEETLLKVAQKTKAVITCEEHTINGGLGSAVSEVLGEHLPTPMVRIGIKDKFGQSGAPQDLLREYNLTKEDIVEAARKLLKSK